MTREQMRDIANKKLSPILRMARLMAEKEILTVAKEIGVPVFEVQRIEECPAEVPCCDLYRLLSHYGPTAQYEANIANIELSLQFREKPQRDGPNTFPR